MGRPPKGTSNGTLPLHVRGDSQQPVLAVHRDDNVGIGGGNPLRARNARQAHRHIARANTPSLQELTATPTHTNEHTHSRAHHLPDNPTPHGNEPPAPHQYKNAQQTRQRQHKRHRAKITQKTAATIKIASWNMRGRGDDKWMHINQTMRQKKIGILCLQETHLSEEHTNTLL